MYHYVLYFANFFMHRLLKNPVMCIGWGSQSWTFFCKSGATAIGGCEKKDLQKPMCGGPSRGWGGQNLWRHRDRLPPSPRSEFCMGQQHLKI
jgi:hypothetical protein